MTTNSSYRPAFKHVLFPVIVYLVMVNKDKNSFNDTLVEGGQTNLKTCSVKNKEEWPKQDHGKQASEAKKQRHVQIVLQKKQVQHFKEGNCLTICERFLKRIYNLRGKIKKVRGGGGGG